MTLETWTAGAWDQSFRHISALGSRFYYSVYSWNRTIRRDVLQHLLTFIFRSTLASTPHVKTVMFVPGLSEVKAVCLLDFILFGRAPAQITRAPLAKKCNNVHHRAPAPSDNRYSASNDEFFVTIMLRKRPVVACCHSPPAAPIIKQRPLAAGDMEDVRFPVGLCYLVSVAPSMRSAAMVELGSYPTVDSLLANWIFNPSKIFLTAQRDGLYHATKSPTACLVPFTLGHGHWRVGADNGFPSLPPRNPQYNMGPPPQPPRGPRVSNNSAQHQRITRFDQQFPMTRGLPDRGAHCGRGRGRGMDPSPFQVQYTDDRRGKETAKVPQRERWEDANITKFEVMIKEMKKSLEDFLRDIAVDAWNDMSAWIKDYLRMTAKSREDSIPFAEAHFSTIRMSASQLATVRQQVLEVSGDAHKLSILLAAKLKELDDLQHRKEEAQPRSDTAQLDKEIAIIKEGARALDAAVAAREKEIQAADRADEIADNADFVPIDDGEPVATTSPWPEDNYEDFATRRNTLVAKQRVTGKVAFSDLVIKQKAPASSKTMMPRAVEFFMVKEIDAITLKSIKSRWCNFYKDPVEPAKCWSEEEFRTYHDWPGFHFMIAHIAQAGAQFNDSKLSVLRAKLSDWWKINVTFQHMQPQMDWMLATILELTDLSKEILSTDLIQLNEGNASYVIQHFTTPSLVHDLEITIANTITNPGSIFAKMKKQCQEFEKAGTPLGWRVAGVRSANAAAKYRATFFLKDVDEYWLWFHDWSHPHGSVPVTIPILNFDPAWKARKAYACQLCYSSDHHLLECPLPHVKIGGVPLVSAISRGLCMSRTAAERRGWLDDILNLIKGGSTQHKGGDAGKPMDGDAAGLVDAHRVMEEVAEKEIGDAIMADHSVPGAIETDLHRAKAHFNNPFSQLRSMLPYLHDDTLHEALEGRSVEEALIYLKVVSPDREIRPVIASGSGPTEARPQPQSYVTSAAEFISSKLQQVFNQTEVVPVDKIVELLQACDGDKLLVVEALRKTGMNFSWDERTMDSEWRDWCDARVTLQAATPISTTMSNMDLLEQPSLYDFRNKASFLAAMVERSNIILHPDIHLPDLAKKYRGQFPAMLQKMQISYNATFPSHWTEKWLMDAYSLWLTIPPNAAAAAENITPTNAATRQATAPVINTSADGNRRM